MFLVNIFLCGLVLGYGEMLFQYDLKGCVMINEIRILL